MAGVQDFWEFTDDFLGAVVTLPTTAENGCPWGINDTSAAGTPTYTYGVDHGETAGDFASGVARLAFDNTAEVQNVCLSFKDGLAFDIDKLRGVEIRLKQNQATVDATTSLAFGVTGDRNDAIDTIAVAAIFRIIGSNSVVVETDDTVNNNDDVATGQSLTNAYKRFKIDFSKKSDVKFYMDRGDGALARVASGTTFDMSNYSAGLQPFIQLQKTANNNTNGIDIDYVHIWGVR
jgi:hypothetical protein